MNAKELQYMMETNEFSLAETLIIAELRRRDEVENVLRSEVQLWKDKYDDQSIALEKQIKINEDLKAKLRDRDATIHELTIHELTTKLTELKSKNSTLRKRFAARGQ